MTNSKDFQNLPGKEHLKKDFSAELNYKLWVTKGARFYAAKRLQKKNSLSIYTIGFLSSYIIIINLFTFLPNLSLYHFAPEVLTIITISLSILVLVFSQIEALNSYSLKAEKIHSCAKEIGKLYNEWRYYKTCAKDSANINDKILDIKDRYEIILDKYDNHEDVDTHLFKANHNDYFEFPKSYVRKAYFDYYLKVYFTYHFLIFSPIIAILVYVMIVVL